ncbi:unnamed protein product, partial [Rotaria sordida]
ISSSVRYYQLNPSEYQHLFSSQLIYFIFHYLMNTHAKHFETLTLLVGVTIRENNDLLYSYKEFIVNSHPNQQTVLHQYIIELFKYQGYIYLIDEIKQWSIPKFSVNKWDLQ